MAFGRYVSGGTPGRAAVDRYLIALEALPELRPAAPLDHRVLTFVRAHPWALGSLDASMAWVRPRSSLRRRLVVMAAILEVSPDEAERCLPPRRTGTAELLVAALRTVAELPRILGGVLVLALLAFPRTGDGHNTSGSSPG